MNIVYPFVLLKIYTSGGHNRNIKSAHDDWKMQVVEICTESTFSVDKEEALSEGHNSVSERERQRIEGRER